MIHLLVYEPQERQMLHEITQATSFKPEAAQIQYNRSEKLQSFLIIYSNYLFFSLGFPLASSRSAHETRN